MKKKGKIQKYIKEKRAFLTLIVLGLVTISSLIIQGIYEDISKKHIDVCRAKLKNIQAELERYYTKNKYYPDNLQILIKEELLDKSTIEDPWGVEIRYYPVCYDSDENEASNYILGSSGPDKYFGSYDDVEPPIKSSIRYFRKSNDIVIDNIIDWDDEYRQLDKENKYESYVKRVINVCKSLKKYIEFHEAAGLVVKKIQSKNIVFSIRLETAGGSDGGNSFDAVWLFEDRHYNVYCVRYSYGKEKLRVIKFGSSKLKRLCEFLDKKEIWDCKSDFKSGEDVADGATSFLSIFYKDRNYQVAVYSLEYANEQSKGINGNVKSIWEVAHELRLIADSKSE